MVPVAAALLAHLRLVAGVDSLYAAVAHELSSRYCPAIRSVFFLRLGLSVTPLLIIALLLFAAGARKARPVHAPANLAAYAIVAFTVGSSLLILYGLSGCGGASAAGLTWDWPF